MSNDSRAPHFTFLLMLIWPAAAAVWGDVPTTTSASLTAPQRAEVRKLQQTATDPQADAATIRSAVAGLADLGEAARPSLRDTLRTLLGRDRSVVERAAAVIGDTARFATFEQELADLRKTARDNIPKLSHDNADATIKLAHKYYDRLTPMLATENAALAVRLPVLEIMSRRAGWLALWAEAAPATDPNFREADEAKLTALAERVLGMTVAAAQEVPAFDGSKAGPPTDGPGGPAVRALWFYRACQQIDAYNAALQATTLSAEEQTNLRLVNTYREALGILPYELDARLVQAARRHSKEMVDLKYFSHESPTAAEKTFGQRCQNAGYAHGSGENIAAGNGAGDGAFWMWFDSPGHHQNMAGGSTAFGVGRWRADWTQDFGSGARLMLQPEEQRQETTIKGTLLAPEAAGNSSSATTPRRGANGGR